MKGIQGVVTGTVKSLEDPEKLGCIQVTYHWMSEEEPASNWARIAVPMAGPERGVQFMPEISDEVLVAFEHGDQRFPFVIGFLWNGKDKLPRENPSQRIIKTVSGHILEFDDIEGEEKISLLFKGEKPSAIFDETTATIETAAGHLLRMDDDGSIELKFKGGDPSIVLSESGLTITFDGGNSIELSSSGVAVTGQEITVTGDSKVSITSPEVEITGDAQVTVTGGVVNVSGNPINLN